MPLALVAGVIQFFRQQSARLRADTGDVPWWVLITLMTAGIVTALWIVAEPKLAGILGNALSISGDPNSK